jgi:hypothetical protein
VTTPPVRTALEYGFPAILFGQYYASDPVGSTGLPRQVGFFATQGASHLPFTWSFGTEAPAGSYAAILEIELQPTATLDPDWTRWNDAARWIWIIPYHSPGFWGGAALFDNRNPNVDLRGVFTDGPAEANRWVRQVMGDGKTVLFSPPALPGVPGPSKITLSGDLTAFLAAARTGGVISDFYYVHAIRAGYWVESGGVGLTLQDFAVSVR